MSHLILLTRVCALILLGALYGCHGDETLAGKYAGASTPLDQLAHVRLGMKAGALQKVRPGVRSAGYTGYTEQLGDYTVAYRIPGSYSEEQRVPDHAAVQAVSATRKLPDDAAAEAEWKRRVAAANLSSEARCFRIEPRPGADSPRGYQAEWKHRSGTFSLAAFHGWTSRQPHGRVTQPPVLIVSVERTTSVFSRVSTAVLDAGIEGLPHIPIRCPGATAAD